MIKEREIGLESRYHKCPAVVRYDIGGNGSGSGSTTINLLF